jgi:uncharacterized damage-inducible protein DinB
MNKQSLLGIRQYFDMVHGITLRAIGTFSNEDLDFRPQPGMRSPRELIYHIYAMEKEIATGVRTGKITQETENVAIPESEAASASLANLDTIAKLQEYASACHKLGNDAAAEISEEELARIVEAPYGSFPAWQFFAFSYDEHWHHRGQLYTYLRLLGKEPPMLYDYENSPA